MRLALIWMVMGFLCRGVAAFSPYYDNGVLYRWDFNYTGYPASTFNTSTKAIKYYLGVDASRPNRVAELNAIRAAFAQWQAVSGTTIKFEEAGIITNPTFTLEDGTNVVFFSRFSRLTNASGVFVHDMVGQAGYTLTGGNAGRIGAGDIALNAAGFSWLTDYENTNVGGMFVEAVALHEIGHFLGLDHTPLGAGCVIDGDEGIGPSSGLSSDEIAAARFLYPAAGSGGLGAIAGTVRMNGVGIRGAIVTVEDGNGFAVSSTETLENGTYNLPALAAGSYKVRVSPMDPPGLPSDQSLFRPDDVYVGYGAAVTAFRPTENVAETVSAGSTVARDFLVVAGEPPLRIQQINRPTQSQFGPSRTRTAVGVYPGQVFFTGVISSTLSADASFSITGNGLTLGPMIFEPNRFGTMHLLQAQVAVTADAMPGIRSFVVRRGNDVAYANGYFEVLSPAPDYNFDGLNDRFQRRYFPIFTAAEAGPASDPDGDRFSNAFEAMTGSDPINALSFNFFIQGITKNASGATVTWRSDLGKQYQLQGRTNLAAGAWEAVATVTANSTTTQALDTSAATNRFYRLQLLP